MKLWKTADRKLLFCSFVLDCRSSYSLDLSPYTSLVAHQCSVYLRFWKHDAITNIFTLKAEHYKRYQKCFFTPIRHDKHPCPFYVGVPPGCLLKSITGQPPALTLYPLWRSADFPKSANKDTLPTGVQYNI